MQQTTPTIDWALVRSTFNSFRTSGQEHGEEPLPELDAILKGDVPALSESVERARKYAARLGATVAAAPQGHAFVNGKHFDLDDVCPVPICWYSAKWPNKLRLCRASCS